MNLIRTILALMIVSFSFWTAFGQQPSNLSSADKKAVIETAFGLLKDNYIFPERAKLIEEFVGQKLRRGGYDAQGNPEEFLESLNSDLQLAGKDRHLKISFGPDRVKQIIAESKAERDGKEVVLADDWLQRLRFENFRLREIQRLDGNIGYFRFLNFPPLTPAKQSFVGSMDFLQYSSALVFDLRENGGGYSETMDFLLGYFLKDGLQIGESRLRKGNKIVKSFVSNDPAVKKISENVPLFILVSNKTSSAAEGFASILQQYRRATIIGEQTQGEGNAGELFVINDLLYMMIPTMESIGPVSRKSIDGIGITPDIRIEASKSLIKAKLEICKKLSERSKIKELQLMYQWQIPYLENQLDPEPLTNTVIKSVVGDYADGRKLIDEGGVVFYINSQGAKEKLEYIGKGVFQNTAKPWLRLVMPFTDNQVPEFKWTWDDGGQPQIVMRVKKN